MEIVGWRVIHFDDTTCVFNAEIVDRAHVDKYMTDRRAKGVEELVTYDEAMVAIKEARGEFEKMSVVGENK